MCRLTDILKAPGMEYRPRNYWGWLENITPEETSWQIDKMYEAGLGGYVMHARGGLTMPYMGKQWVESVKAMIETGKKHGMVTIADDEHGWPSGFGAGKVNGLGKDYQLKYLLCEEAPAGSTECSEGTLGLWLKRDFSPVSDISQVPADEAVVRVYYKIDPFYVDNMDAKVVRAFIDASYEDYKRHVGSSFGDGLYGIFSDEPQVARYSTPWSFTIPALFIECYGYDLIPVIYKLFYDVPGCEKVRYDTFCLMQKCFVENYAKQIYEWCDENGLAFMGHTCLEDDLYQQIRNSVGTMAFYEYMHVPGIDWLCRVPLNNMTILQLTSAAAQMGKKRVLSEMYGCAGWNVSLEELRWIAQWQAVLGVNDQLQHLGLYSLRGSRKREYPASLFYQQPWFEKYRPYNEYFARISKMLCETKPETDVLLLHPMKSAFVTYNGLDDSRTNKLQSDFIGLTDLLLGMNISLHYGDEVLMARHGRVADSRLIIGCESYSTVILPSVCTLDMSTCSLLEQLIDQGGRVIIAGDAPYLLEGAPDSAVKDLCSRFERVEPTYEGISAAIKRTGYVKCTDSENRLIYVSRREFEGKKVYYIVNNDLQHGYDFEFVTGSDICLREYYPMTGELSEYRADTARLHIDAAGAMILMEDTADGRPCAPEKFYSGCITLDGEFDIVKTTDNFLTLDRCCLSFDGESFFDEDFHLNIQKRLISDGMDRDIWLSFSFNVDTVPEGQLYLIIEDPQRHEILLNGQPVSNISQGWVVDKCLEKLPITVKQGRNTILLKRRFKNPANVYRVKNDPTIHEAESNRVTVETEIESIYIMGQFAVTNRAETKLTDRRTVCTSGDFSITTLPAKVDIGRIEREGFPYFAGSITLEKEFILDEVPQAARIVTGRPDTIISEHSINNTDVGMLFWAPYELDVTDKLKKGLNKLSVTLTNSCRNMFGPHHNLECEPYGVGPHSYPPQTTDIYLVRFGIEDGIKIEMSR